LRGRKLSRQRSHVGAELGDRRRAEQAKSIAESLYRHPTSGFPRALSSSAELEAFYRFVNSHGFSASDIIEPHINTSVARAKAQGEVVAIHDTTSFEYSTERGGFGYTTHLDKADGFIAHVSLLVSESESMLLGVGHLETWTRGASDCCTCRQGFAYKFTSATEGTSTEVDAI
jgi:hypothetical protein